MAANIGSRDQTKLGNPEEGNEQQLETLDSVKGTVSTGENSGADLEIQDKETNDALLAADNSVSAVQGSDSSCCEESENVGSPVEIDEAEVVSSSGVLATKEVVEASSEAKEVGDSDQKGASLEDESIPVESSDASCVDSEKQPVGISESTGESQEKAEVSEPLVQHEPSESVACIENTPLETLTFNLSESARDSKDKEAGAQDVCVCPLCDRSYPSSDSEDILAHLVLMHKFVIADVNFIGDLTEYMRYWKKRFEEKPYTEFCSKIVTNTEVKDDAEKEEFFLLCDALPDDKMIREDLQRKRLVSVLAQQQKEREETKFCRSCLFCKQTFCGNRAVLVEHLLKNHTFHLGQADNLVFTDELFNLIESKLDNCLCLFCEKQFRDKASQKEHMRKKQHRKINPKCKEFDRFYIVNYMDVGKNWESLTADSKASKTSEKESDEEDEWGDWNAESEPKVVCLFCDVASVTMTDLQQHMKEKHSFDQKEVHQKLQLNFYQKVKLINFIRRQVYQKTCYGCQHVFDSRDELLAHLDEFSDHVSKVPDGDLWDQPQYFRPTYENDSLLCHLADSDDNDDDKDDDDGADSQDMTVFQEDVPANIIANTVLTDKKLYKSLLMT